MYLDRGCFRGFVYGLDILASSSGSVGGSVQEDRLLGFVELVGSSVFGLAPFDELWLVDRC